MGITRVTRNYQITLPRDVREMEKINIGDKLIVTVRDEEIVMKKVKAKILEKAFGSWNTKGSGVDYVRSIRKESEKREKRLGL